MFNSREYILNDLTEAILDGIVNDDVYIEARAKAEKIKTDKEKRKAESKIRHQAELAKKQKFENRFPEVWKYKHVYMSHLVDCCTNSPLDDMQKYASEMMNGKHRVEFKDPDVALSYLNSHITQRINQSNQTFNVKEAIAKHKEEIKRDKAEINEKYKEMHNLRRETITLEAKLNPQSPVRAKAYTI